MSIFNELLPKIYEISNVYTKNFNDRLQAAFTSLDKYEEELQNQNGRRKTREKAPKDKNAMTTLQSIDEGEDESKKQSDPDISKATKPAKISTGSQSSDNNERSAPKKRSKHEVEDMSSPEQDKRQKRNASVKAQSIISKQVNVNLSQKLRRENSMKEIGAKPTSRSQRQKDNEKENVVPNELPLVQIKQEKISLPPEPEPMDTVLDVPVKQEIQSDFMAMPPPTAPVPKPRKGVAKEKFQEEPIEEDNTRRSRRATRTKKQDSVPAPVPAERSTRSGSRVRTEASPPPAETRPKRTRGRKKLSEIRADSGHSTQSSQESLPSSPAEKPRPKRTRRAQKAEKEQTKASEPEPVISAKEERKSQEQISSPIISQTEIRTKNKKDKAHTIIELDHTKDSTNNITDLSKTSEKSTGKTKNNDDQVIPNAKTTKDKNSKTKPNKVNDKINGLVKNKSIEKIESVDQVDTVLDETRVLSKGIEMDQTMVLPNGVYNHAPVTSKDVQMNVTVVLDKTMVLDKPQPMDATVILDKGPAPTNVTDDNSLLTDDNDSHEDIPETPPKKGIPQAQPASAVKEKVQQFEEMASRVTRTKTRAMAKKEEDPETATQTPPERVCKVVLTNETLTKMNNLIFNGKPLQVLSSATKPRVNIPPSKPVPSSASKLSANKWREAAEETLKREDARQKKEAMLEAKREQQKRKREEKMAAAAAARSLAEKERKAVLEAAAKERMEKQLHAENEKNERLKEVERKKQELARKVMETEERRKAEETARQQRLAEEQRRALELRKKQVEEQEAMKREEARMNKEFEKKHREYLEKQKKQKVDKMNTPFKTPGTPLSKYHNHPPLPPVYMEDGFQYLNSDEDADPPERPIPTWSTSKVRRHRLMIQSMVKKSLVDRLFSVGVHSPLLSEIFPTIERSRLKRTSSAVWHTPPYKQHS